MSTDYMEIGPVPSDEPCESLGPGYRSDVARAECGLFIRAIKQVMGEPPEGARLVIRSNPHDFGTYYEVACKFDEDNEAAVDYAFKCEGDSPTRWPENLRVEAERLREGGERTSGTRRYST